TGTLAQAGAAPALLKLLAELVPAKLRLMLVGGAAVRRQFLLAQRRDGDEDLFFIANTSMEEHLCGVALRVTDGHAATIARLDLETGEAEPLSAPWLPASGEQRLDLRFAPHGAHLLLVRREP